jgi:hypothetical protein
MAEQQANDHVPLQSLWAYRSAKTPLSNVQFQHLYHCNECLCLLGLCQVSQTWEEVERAAKERKAS